MVLQIKAGPHSVAVCEFVTGGWSSLGLEMCLDLKSILTHPSWLQKLGWLCILKVKTAVYAQNVKYIVNAFDFQSFISSMHKYKRTNSQKVEQFRYLCLMFSWVWLLPFSPFLISTVQTLLSAWYQLCLDADGNTKCLLSVSTWELLQFELKISHLKSCESSLPTEKVIQGKFSCWCFNASTNGSLCLSSGTIWKKSTPHGLWLYRWGTLNGRGNGFPHEQITRG